MNPSAIVVQFPGSNCEYETQRTLQEVGFDAKILRWNEDPQPLDNAHVIMLPGGFSYQDRVRAGAIAAKLPILDRIKKANERGTLIMGICNGCQILVETGLVPRLESDIECSMTHNHILSTPINYMCKWVHVKIENASGSPFTNKFEEGAIIPIQIAHAEGCFEFKSSVNHSDIKPFTKLTYCTSNGEVATDFPDNPNGSQFDLAGITNKQGNVLAIMPHPERSVFIHQVPVSLKDHWALKKGSVDHSTEEGPWYPLFRGMREGV